MSKHSCCRPRRKGAPRDSLTAVNAAPRGSWLVDSGFAVDVLDGEGCLCRPARTSKRGALDPCANRGSTDLRDFWVFARYPLSDSGTNWFCQCLIPVRHAGGFPAHIEDSMDVRIAHLIQRQGTPPIPIRCTRPPLSQPFRQIGDIDEIAAAGETGAGDDVLQLAHVSRPGMPQQDGLRTPGQPGDCLSISFVYFFRKNCISSGYPPGTRPAEGCESVELNR